MSAGPLKLVCDLAGAWTSESQHDLTGADCGGGPGPAGEGV